MQLKFSQMAVGTRFRFEDAEWVKIGPLTAQSAQGRQRLMARSALVQAIAAPESGDALPLASPELRREVVERSFAKLCELTESLLGELERGEIDPQTARKRFRACYAAALSALDPSPPE